MELLRREQRENKAIPSPKQFVKLSTFRIGTSLPRCSSGDRLVSVNFCAHFLTFGPTEPRPPCPQPLSSRSAFYYPSEWSRNRDGDSMRIVEELGGFPGWRHKVAGHCGQWVGKKNWRRDINWVLWLWVTGWVVDVEDGKMLLGCVQSEPPINKIHGNLHHKMKIFAPVVFQNMCMNHYQDATAKSIPTPPPKTLLQWRASSRRSTRFYSWKMAETWFSNFHQTTPPLWNSSIKRTHDVGCRQTATKAAQRPAAGGQRHDGVAGTPRGQGGMGLSLFRVCGLRRK
ncbi:hypothetical protein SESBI_17626 [Sesbania bispinosa]|nr:hypothetical protein SESBI_17626 [Sesbania bispinosa]